MAPKINQLLRPDFHPKRLLHDCGVRMADVETDEGADIFQDGLLDRRQKLVDKLMGKDQTQVVFTGFGEN